MKRLLLLLMLCFSGMAWATVPAVPYTVTYTCTGGFGPFAFTFPITDPTALTVKLNGVLLASTSYTTIPVNNNYNNGGNVTLGGAFPCTAGQPLVLTRVTPITQTVQYYNNMPSLPIITGNGVDKLTEIAQELNGLIGQIAAGGLSITASSPIVVTPSPITGIGIISCPTCATGSTGGTVTSFSASPTVAPFFTTNVTNPTTTPALIFTVDSIAADNIFGNFTGSSAVPSTQAIPPCANDGSHALVYVSHVLTCETLVAPGAVTAVNGTANQIDSSGGTTPTISLDGQFTSVSYATCTNTADVLTVTPVPTPTALVNGLTVQCKSSAANTTSTPHLIVGSLGSRVIVKSGVTGQAALVANDILTNMVARFTYDLATTTWELQNPQQGAAGTAVTSVTGTAPIVSSGGTTPAISCPTCITETSPSAGIFRSAGGTQAATTSELSGDATTSGSNAVSVVKVNGAALPASKAFVGTNSSNQLIDATSTLCSSSVFGICKVDGTTITASAGVISAAGSGLSSIQFKNSGTNFGSAMTGAGSMNFVGATVSGTAPNFTVTVTGGGGTPVYKTEPGPTYTLLTTDFSSPAAGCGYINLTGTSAAITVPSSGTPVTAGQCVVLIETTFNGSATIVANGQTVHLNTTIQYGNACTLISDGTDFWCSWQASGIDDGNGDVYFGNTQFGIHNAQNTFIGSTIGSSGGMSGSGDTFIGYQAGKVTTSQSQSVFVGYQAGQRVTSGANNTYVGGVNVAGDATTGQRNSVFGSNNGLTLTTGSSNVLIGADANGGGFCDVPSGGTSNYVCFGGLLYGDWSKGILILKGPTTTIAGNACGSTVQGTLASGSNDMVGEVTVGTVAVTSCAVSFANTHNQAPFCTVTSQAGATVVGFGYTISTTTLTVTATSGFSSSKFDYTCIAGSTSGQPTP